MTASIHPCLARCLVSAALAVSLTSPAMAQVPPPSAASLNTQDPTKVFRGGLWKQFIYWAIPGPTAYAAIQRVVAEVNTARSAVGLPILIPNPASEIVVSVFDEHNARGPSGRSIYPATSNQEAFLATFVDDSAGGSEVLFLTDPFRSNDGLAALGVSGVSARVSRELELNSEDGIEKVKTEWTFTSTAGDQIEFKASYPSTAIYYRAVGPLRRLDYAATNLAHSADLIFRTAPTQVFPLFAREEGNFVDLTAKGVHVKVHVNHGDPDIQAIFNDSRNTPEVLIALDRDVRIESR